MFKINLSAFIILALTLINPISYRNAVIYSQTSGSYSEYTETGTASWYGPGFHGRKTANGERFDTYALTCAHKTLPFNTILKVTNLENGRYAVVRVNDRGPYSKGRIIDLSNAAKNEIGMAGLAKVKIELFQPENESGSDLGDANTSLTLFEDAITYTSKVFIQLQDGKTTFKGTKSKTQDELRRVLSNFKRVKLIIDKDNGIKDGLGTETRDKNESTDVLDFTSKISTFTGYSIEVTNFSDETEAAELIGKLEALNFDTVLLVEIDSKDATNFKVFVGYYADKYDTVYDLRLLTEYGFDAKIIKILS